VQPPGVDHDAIGEALPVVAPAVAAPIMAVARTRRRFMALSEGAL
jgi:hypothetical protein